MNYVNFKNYANHRLDTIKEDLIRTVNIPENTITYDGIKGSYVINPFGANEYSFDVVLNSEKDLNDFIKEISKSDIYESMCLDANVKIDGIHEHYVVTGFINKAILDDIQVEFKNILNNR